jgi:hypothetical protein
VPRPELTPEEIVAILRTSVPDLRAITDPLSDAQLDYAASDDDWSIRYIVAHLHSSEDVLGTQMMRIIAEDKPAWKRLSPREFIRKTDYPDWDVSRALEAIDDHRTKLLSVVEPLPQAGWTRVAVVTDAPGKVVDHTLRFYGNWLADHERGHLDQIREIVANLP